MRWCWRFPTRWSQSGSDRCAYGRSPAEARLSCPTHPSKKTKANSLLRVRRAVADARWAMKEGRRSNASSALHCSLASCKLVEVSLQIEQLPLQKATYSHTRTRAHTHARTNARTHARTHTNYNSTSPPVGNSSCKMLEKSSVNHAARHVGPPCVKSLAAGARHKRCWGELHAPCVFSCSSAAAAFADCCVTDYNSLTKSQKSTKKQQQAAGGEGLSRRCV